MKATFDDFITKNPTWKDFADNTDAEIVFSILSRPASIHSMISAIAAEKPALTPCVIAIEGVLENLPNTTMLLGRERNRQAVGLMVKTVLEPYGYVPVREANGGAKTKPLPDESHARYFKEAALYQSALKG